jgi:hypothetical protein
MRFPLLVAALMVAIPGIGAVWALIRFLTSLHRDHVLADTPLARIRSAPQGYVKVYGRAKAVADRPTAAPLSARPCVWWSFEVERRRRDRDNDRQWVPVESAASVECFLVSDGDGECLVGPVNADITPTHLDTWYGDSPRPGAAPVSPRPLLASGEYRYTEQLIAVGAHLSVIGELRSHSETGDLAAATTAVLHAWKADQPELLRRFDRNRDGRIDADEWEAVRQAAEEYARRESLGAPVTRTTVIAEPTSGEPFLIAPMDSARLATRERIHAALYFGLGLACIALCAWAIEHVHFVLDARS